MVTYGNFSAPYLMTALIKLYSIRLYKKNSFSFFLCLFFFVSSSLSGWWLQKNTLIIKKRLCLGHIQSARTWASPHTMVLGLGFVMCVCVCSQCLSCVLLLWQDDWSSNDSSSRREIGNSEDKASQETLPPG